MMASSQQRLVQNQRSFRAANERFGEMVEVRADGDRIPFLCECSNSDCRGRIEMTTKDYDAIHVVRTHFMILPGHAMVGGETVRGVDGDGYLVVQK